MYLKNIIIENMGSVERFELLEKDLIKENENPRILILVGQNGTGKTTLLSSIVDAFYEFANDSFTDILPKFGTGYKYFKLSGSINVQINKKYGFSYLQFKHNTKIYEYIDKNGNLTFEENKEKTNNLLTLSNSWKDDANLKLHTNTNDEFSDNFKNNSYCFFPSDRFEYPYWLNNEYLNQNEQLKEVEKFSNRLKKEILIKKSLSELKTWILDLFLDSRVDLVKTVNEEGKSEYGTRQNLAEIELLKKSVENINILISKILGLEVELEVNFRGRGNSRLKLVDKTTRQDVLPSLNSLSAGQSTLLSIFLNVIKSSDIGDLRKSINLEQINGIVLIDEIDLHLHIELQKEILPKLIKLFPKVQFIITSHSPFFLNGMAKTFEQDDYIVVNMPSGKILNAYDEFEEFNKAYEIFEDLTNDYKKERDLLKLEIEKSTKPIIITEGKTDWKHLKKALERFKSQGLYTNLDIEFLEYEENIKMGDDSLDSMVKAFKKTSQSRKTIFMFDRDNNKIFGEYGNEEFNNHLNNVYSFCIPKIDDTLNKISLEFYYKEDELKIFDGNGRRLFLSSEFNQKTAVSKCRKFVTQDKNKASKSLAIIDDAVFSLDDEECKTNLAISKNIFAENILKDVENFKNFDIENFKKIFEVIEEIYNL
ncbi:AAA family ATPase [Aliarcobacter butzleri]|uniref:AAA family ATPase n=1 Tax=Aliarcobacter butzleri TaxID=28197 RepID=UPI003AF48599|nr:ATP-binding protein [Aliarcobacter butzleri]